MSNFKGKVKWFSQEKGFGFIKDDEGVVLPLSSIITSPIKDWVKFINNINKLKSDIKKSRSCFTCKLSTVCFAFKDFKEVLTKLPVNIDGNDAPLKQIEVFNTLAGCCLVYEENK